MGKINNVFSTAPQAANEFNRSGDKREPVKLEFDPRDIGARRQEKNGRYPATAAITETAVETALLKKFGFDTNNPADLARVKQLLQTEGSPFAALQTTGSFTAAYNNRTGKYEIISSVEKNLYKQLQGKAAEVKAQVEREKQTAVTNPANPNEVIAAKNGITNNNRAALENKLNNQPSISARNRTESEKTVDGITGAIESVTGTGDPFAGSEIGRQFNRLGVSSLRLAGKALELSNYFGEKINDAARSVAPDAVDNLLNQADKTNRENAQALQNASSAVTNEDTFIDKRAAQLGREIPLTEDLANKIMYFPEAIPNAIDSAIKGDFKPDDGSYSDKVGKIIGGLNPAGDVRDIIANGKKVVQGDGKATIPLIASVIGAIPGGGDVAKPIIKEVGEELTEKAVKEVGTETAEKLSKEEVENLTKQTQSVFPRGFKNVEQFNKAVSDIRSSLKVDDATIGVRGSSVTGVKFKNGESFDASSDIDFFVVSDKVYAQGIEKGAKGSNGAFKVGATRKYFPEIHEAEKSLSEQLGRKVTIRIFNKEGFEAVKAGQEILVR